MYLVMTATVGIGMYLGRRLLISHATAAVQTAMGMPTRTSQERNEEGFAYALARTRRGHSAPAGVPSARSQSPATSQVLNGAVAEQVFSISVSSGPPAKGGRGRC